MPKKSENDLYAIASNRSQNSISPELLKRSQGFQFTSHKGKIIHIDLDSSIVHAQIQQGLLVKEDVLESLLATINAIDKSLLDLSSIRIVGNSDDIRMLELKDYLAKELIKRKANHYFWSNKIKVKIISRDEKPEFSLH
ncbi:MAG: hypothetical protein JNM93_12430 [Bacteriovoracaceae bacterium]|nr:hypothetical protein [Bacteriovoracaceae bacterium]